MGAGDDRAPIHTRCFDEQVWVSTAQAKGPMFEENLAGVCAVGSVEGGDRNSWLKLCWGVVIGQNAYRAVSRCFAGWLNKSLAGPL